MSFTKAAHELLLTQGTVSQQVKLLEEHLGYILINREGRSIELTSSGMTLHKAVNEALSGLRKVLSSLASEQDQALRISCPPSFAMKWLTPRLHSLQGLMVEREILLTGEMRDANANTMAVEGVGAAVHFHSVLPPAISAVEFLDEWITPVASPAFLNLHPEVKTPGRLDGSLLLHDSDPWQGAIAFEEWIGWAQNSGVELSDISRGQRFNMSQMAIEAVVGGNGIAMGRAALVLEDLEAGRLTRLFPLAVRSPATYQLVIASESSKHALQLRDWFLEQGEEFKMRRSALWAV